MNAQEIPTYLSSCLLPLWADAALDRRHGGFYSRLSGTLEPIASDSKRVLVQTRLLWTFSDAARSGGDPRFRRIADELFDFLLERCRDEKGGGWFATLTHAGEPLDATKDTYIHAFVLYSLAGYFLLSGEARARDEALQTTQVLDEKLGDANGRGYLEAASRDWLPERGIRRQNPHMHLLEAFLALYEATDEGVYLLRAQQIVQLFKDVFFESGSGILREFFETDWSVSANEGHRLEPGHHFEWVWLLHEYARLSGDESVLDDARNLFAAGSERGIDRELGGVFDEVDEVGRVLRDTKRIWPQTEYLRAAGLLDPNQVPETLKRCGARYVDPEHRGWYEQTDRAGAVIERTMNASSVYHIYGALRSVASLSRG